MPGKRTKVKVIHCDTCHKEIARFRRSAYPGNHVPKEKILKAIRRHYKEKHPGKFRESIKRGVEARKGGGHMARKRKKGGKKWGKIGAPKSAKRKRWLKSIRKKRR